ncbi:MAG TPA: DNA-binding domain-containing protein [Lacunisphaera sp.]|nr:DNA-binding domain-containing protein [Lacunisphaera sp.]
MPAAPKRIAPTEVRSTGQLAALQRAMWGVISRPLTDDSRMQPRWSDGRPTDEVAGQIAKPNDRLTSFERLEIYNRMYWFRVLDSLYDDCPGLRAVLGDPKFIALAEAYLVKYPSRSFTLRNLPDRLAQFIREEPRFTRPRTALCHDLARFEWARVEVFDTATKPLFTTNDLLDVPPAKQGKLKLALQPYLQLLKLDYPVDEFILTVKQREAELLRGDASNAPSALRRLRHRKVKLPARARTYVAVHRLEGQIYFKRLEPAAFRILVALRGGATLEQALATGLPRSKKAQAAWAGKVRDWFQNWMQLGWLCRA